jgi:hypothetical protein
LALIIRIFQTFFTSPLDRGEWSASRSNRNYRTKVSFGKPNVIENIPNNYHDYCISSVFLGRHERTSNMYKVYGIYCALKGSGLGGDIWHNCRETKLK